MNTRGFTLIELMIVIAILGILSAIAIPAYGDYVNRAKASETITLIGGVRTPIAEFFKDRERFPADNEEAGLPPADKIIGTYVISVEYANGAFHATMGNEAGQYLEGKVLTMRAASVPDYPMVPLSWVCGYREAVDGMQAHGENRTDIPKQYLPSSCR